MHAAPTIAVWELRATGCMLMLLRGPLFFVIMYDAVLQAVAVVILSFVRRLACCGWSRVATVASNIGLQATLGWHLLPSNYRYWQQQWHRQILGHSGSSVISYQLKRLDGEHDPCKFVVMLIFVVIQTAWEHHKTVKVIERSQKDSVFLL